MATFWEIAARSVGHIFSLSFVYLLYLFISSFGFKSGICRLIAPVPVRCFSIQYLDIKRPRKSGNTVFSIITLSVAMETSSRIWPNFKLIQALMYVIVTCKYEMDPIKNSQEKVARLFSHYKSMGIFS